MSWQTLLTDQKIKMHSTSKRELDDLKSLPSHKSAVIQLADVTAYVLQRNERESFTMPKLRRMARKLWEKEGNKIWWGGMDDLRSYLSP